MARGRLPLRVLGWFGMGLLWVLLLVTVLLLATLDLIRRPGGQAKLRELVLQQTAEILPGLKVERIEGDFTSSLGLRGVVLRDRFGGPAIRAAGVRLRYDLARLATAGEIRVTSVELDRPVVQLRPAKNGNLNLAELVVLEPSPEPEPPSEPTTLRLRVDQLRITGGSLEVAGEGQPLRVDDLELDLGARAGINDIAARLRKIAARVRLPDGQDFRVALQGRAAVDPRRVDADLGLQVTGFTPQGQVTLNLKASGPHSRVALDLGLGLPGKASLSLDGWAGVDASWRPSYDLKLALARVDPSKLLQGLIPAQVNLELQAEGQGIPLQPASRARVDVDVGESTVMGFALRSLKLTAKTEDAGWKLERLALRTPGGRVGATAEGTLERVNARVDVHLPSLARLPARLHRMGVPRDLAGAVSLHARVKGPFGGPLTARARLRLAQLAVAGIKLDRAELDAGFSGLPAAPAGKLDLALEGLDPGDRRLAIDRATLKVNGTPRRLHLALSADGPRARARLAAATAIAGGGKRVTTDLERLELAALGYRVKLRNQPTATYGREIAITPMRLALLGGVVQVEGVFRPHGFPRLEARVGLRGVRPPGLKRRVNARISAQLLRGQAVAQVEGDLPSMPGSSVRVDARVPVRYRRGAPVPHDLVWKGEGQVSASVKRLRLALLNELVPKLEPARGEADLDLAVSGRLNDPQVQLELDLRRAGLGQVSGVTARTRLSIARQQTRLSHNLVLGGEPLVDLEATAATSLGPLMQGPLGLQRLGTLPLTLRLQAHPVRISELPRVHPVLGRFDGVAAARLQLGGTLLRPTVWLRTTLRDGKINGSLKLGDVTNEVTVAVEDDRIRTSVSVDQDRTALLRTRATAGLKLDELVTGAVPKSFPIQAEARVAGYPLSRLGRLGPQLEGIDGTLDLDATVTGTSTAPTGKVGLKVARAGYTGVRIGDLKADASFDGQRIDTALQLAQPRGGFIRWRGGWNALAASGLEGRLHGEKLDLAFLHRLVGPVKDSAGKLKLDIKARGALTRPLVTGSIALEGGKLRLRGLSAFKGIGMKVELQPRRIHLARLQLEGDDGSISASGDVRLTQPELDAARGAALLDRFSLLAKARDFAFNTGQISGLVFSGDVGVGGHVKGNRLAVKVKIDDGVVKVPKVEGGNDLHSTEPLPDVVYVDEERARARKAAAVAAGEQPPSAPPLALRVEVGADPLFVRGEELDLEVATDLVARTDAQGRMRIKGQVEIRRGRIRALNNTFDVRQATVSFSGEPNPDPALNVLLAREAPEATILLQLTGTATAPELALRSDPPIYDQGQIMSLLLTGRVDARPESGEGGDQTMMVASAVSQMLLGGIAQKIAPKVGLDVAKVSLDEAKNKQTGESQLRAEAEVGKYLTERLYLGYRRVFGAEAEENANEALLEYRISARWLLTALFGDAGVGGVDLFWNLRY